MSKPTYNDADIMLKFVQLGAALKIEKALNWIWSEKYIDDYADFVKKYPAGSKEYGEVKKVCGWYETIGTFYKQKLFNEDLLFDWLATNVRWKRIENFVQGVRNEMGEQKMYQNFEAMAKAELKRSKSA